MLCHKNSEIPHICTIILLGCPKTGTIDDIIEIEKEEEENEMPMKRDDHEGLLNELLTPELEHSRRTEILQALRVDYGTVLTDFDTATKTTEKLQRDNSDLVVSNSKLFRQLGTQENPDAKKKEDEKTFSETVTLESLEQPK